MSKLKEDLREVMGNRWFVWVVVFLFFMSNITSLIVNAILTNRINYLIKENSELRTQIIKKYTPSTRE